MITFCQIGEISAILFSAPITEESFFENLFSDKATSPASILWINQEKEQEKEECLFFDTPKNGGRFCYYRICYDEKTQIKSIVRYRTIEKVSIVKKLSPKQCKLLLEKLNKEKEP